MIRRFLRHENAFFAVPVVAALALGMAMLGLTAAVLATHSSRAVLVDRQLAQARSAADTGVERVKPFLLADPLWHDGRVAEGPVDETSEVEAVEIHHLELGDGRVLALVSSTGRAGTIRKSVRTEIEISLLSLITSYGGGIKVLATEGEGLRLGGSALINSNLLLRRPLMVDSAAAGIGTPREPRTVYVEGGVSSSVAKTKIFGDVFATGAVQSGVASGEAVSGWTPPEPFPDIGIVAEVIAQARVLAQALERSGGVPHYLPGGYRFSSLEIEGLSGIYFVEGDAYLAGGTSGARAAVVASGNIWVEDRLEAPNLTIIAGGGIVLPVKPVALALAVAGGDAGWRAPGGGSGIFSLEMGALVARTLNGNALRGNVTLTQNGAVDFATLVAPVHTLRVLTKAEL